MMVYSSFYYDLESSVYASVRNFILTLIVKGKFHSKALLDKISRLDGNFQHLTFINIGCRKNSSIESTTYLNLTKISPFFSVIHFFVTPESSRAMVSSFEALHVEIQVALISKKT